MTESVAEQELCDLAPVRRMAALLDLDPGAFEEGDRLPRGWHVLLFNAVTPQRELGADGYVRPPADLGLERPRLMLGGRRLTWHGDVAIGQRLRRLSRITLDAPKEGRSGRLVRATRHREIADAGGGPVLLTEEEDLIYIEGARSAPSTAAAATQQPRHHSMAFQPDEALLFRYSALTYNAHRIHYDLAYATAVEGYPALVVNGGLTALFLLEFFRRLSGSPPARLSIRNRRPLYCGRPGTLNALQAGPHWKLWAEDDTGQTAADMEVEACSSP